MNDGQDNKISSSGLRYKSKVAGRPYGLDGNLGTMSCIKCGVHKPRINGVFKNFAGRRQFVCGDCRSEN